MPLKMSIAPNESVHLPNGVVLRSDRRINFVIEEGYLPFVRDRDYVHEHETENNLRAQFRFALQEHYLNDLPVVGVYDAAEELTNAVAAVRPVVAETMQYVREDRIFKAVMFAARNLEY